MYFSKHVNIIYTPFYLGLPLFWYVPLDDGLKKTLWGGSGQITSILKGAAFGGNETVWRPLDQGQ